MINSKRKKRQTTIYKTLHIKLKIVSWCPDLVTRTSLKTNNGLQNITHKTKDLVTRTPLKTNNDLQNIHIKLKIE